MFFMYWIPLSFDLTSNLVLPYQRPSSYFVVLAFLWINIFWSKASYLCLHLWIPRSVRNPSSHLTMIIQVHGHTCGQGQENRCTAHGYRSQSTIQLWIPDENNASLGTVLITYYYACRYSYDVFVGTCMTFLWRHYFYCSQTTLYWLNVIYITHLGKACLIVEFKVIAI